MKNFKSPVDRSLSAGWHGNSNRAPGTDRAASEARERDFLESLSLDSDSDPARISPRTSETGLKETVNSVVLRLTSADLWFEDL